MDLNVSSVNVANSYSVDKRQNIGFKGNLYRVPIKQELEFARFKLGQKTTSIMAKVRKFFGIKSLKEKYDPRSQAIFQRQLEGIFAPQTSYDLKLSEKFLNTMVLIDAPKRAREYIVTMEKLYKMASLQEISNMNRLAFSDLVKSAVEKGIITDKEGKNAIKQRKDYIKLSYNEIMRAFHREDIDRKTFKSLVKEAVKEGTISKNGAKELVEKRNFRDFLNSSFVTKILEKYSQK